jgi:ERCC4-type nuclease
MSYSDPQPLGVALAAVVLVAVQARAAVGEWWADVQRRRQPSPLEQLEREYAQTDMDEAEFERRVDELLTADDEVIRDAVQDVTGIGEGIAGEVALHFESVEHVRQASHDELTRVPHVGEDRAQSIRVHFDDGVSGDE